MYWDSNQCRWYDIHLSKTIAFLQLTMLDMDDMKPLTFVWWLRSLVANFLGCLGVKHVASVLAVTSGKMWIIWACTGIKLPHIYVHFHIIFISFISWLSGILNFDWSIEATGTCKISAQTVIYTEVTQQYKKERFKCLLPSQGRSLSCSVLLSRAGP